MQPLLHSSSWPKHHLYPSICHGVCKDVGVGRCPLPGFGCIWVSGIWPAGLMAFVLFQFYIIGMCTASRHRVPVFDGRRPRRTCRKIRSTGIATDVLVHRWTSWLGGCSLPPRFLALCPNPFCGRSCMSPNGRLCKWVSRGVPSEP